MLDELAHSIYIHIPFCRRRCFYCDFAISTGSKHWQEHYVQVLCQEIALTAANVNKQNFLGLKTVFFGGGTPSLLSVWQLAEILEAIALHFGIAADAEISLEANPGTVTLASLQGYKAAGVNRLSLGAQAFQQELLDTCGRGHGVAEIYEAVNAIQAVGIDNWSLDLISGLPQQTMQEWQVSLESAIALAPPHISVYDLIVEPETAFGKRYHMGDAPLPSEELTVEMYLMARSLLQEAGYEHYEISNYARHGYQCQHNLVYWHNQPFYGVGMGATSYIHHQRIDRPRKLPDYFQMVENWANHGIIPTVPRLQPAEELLDTLMQGLRLAQGLNLEALQQRYGQTLIAKVLACLEPYFNKGWARITEGQLILVAPDGWLFSNEIIADLFANF